MNRRRALLSIAVILVVVALIAVTISKFRGPRDSSLREVKIAYVPFSANLPFFIALEKGYFDQQHLRILPVKTADTSEMLNALLAGDVQAVAPVGFAAVFGVEQRSPGSVKAYLPGGETTGHVVSNILIPRDSIIKSPEELRGKKIGTYTGASQFMNLKLILSGLGIDPDKDCTIVQVAPNLQVQALQVGQFDALFTVEPFSTAALAKGFAKSLVDNPRSRFIVDPFVSGACVFTTRLLETDFDLAQRIYRAMNAGVSFIQSYPKEAKAILAKYIDTSPDVLQVTDLYAWFRVDEKTLSATQALVDVSVKYGLLKQRVDAKGLFSEEARLAGSH